MQKHEAARDTTVDVGAAGGEMRKVPDMLFTDVEVGVKNPSEEATVHLTDIEVSAAVEAPPPDSQGMLTRRQIEVLDLLARGRTNPQIAAELVLSTGTVRTHVQRITARLGVSDRTGAVVQAIEMGLIQPRTTRD